MKKIIYIILLSVSASFAFTSCTEEEITPTTTEEYNNGGGSSGSKL